MFRAALVALLVSGPAWSDVPRMELGVGLWQHDMSGTLTSDDPLLAIPPGFDLQTDRSLYERFGFRLGSAWWAPMIRARHTKFSGTGASFVDNSTPPLLVDTTSTQTQMDFDQLEGLIYFTVGSTIRAELGGGVDKLDGKIQSTQVHDTTLGGTTTANGERDLPEQVRVFYGALYAEPVSWLSFGGETVGSSGGTTDVRDTTFRFIIKPWNWMGVEGGYRKLNVDAQNVNNAAYSFEFGGAYAGLSFLYGSKEPGVLTTHDADKDGVPDEQDRCAGTEPGTAVDARGCVPDADHDGTPDARDDCPSTPAGAKVDASGCPTDADVDGVADGLDKCPNSPAGVPVDANGCPKDADHDGVPDELDKCPGSAAGAVDAAGCPLTQAAVSEPPAAGGPDEDYDGVPDALDRCRRTPRGLKVDGTGCALPSMTVLQGVTFQKNSSYLMRDSEVLLLDVVEALKAQPKMKVEIQGHTCDLGPAKYNKWLSQRRANRVLEFLVRHGIDARRLVSLGYGEEQPMVPNDDESMRELNRRTVFRVLE